jgi:hypothetical protein
MKKLITYSFVIAAMLLAASFTPPKPAAPFEGIIVFEMHATTVKPPGEKLMKDCSITFYIKGNKTKMVTEKAGVTTIVISDDMKPNGNVTLEEFMGKKYRVKEEPDDDDKEAPPTYSVQYIDSTQTIAGFTCKKAIITKKTADYTSVLRVFYSDQLPNMNAYKGDYKSLKGFPLEYNRTITSSFGMHMIATSVTKQSLPDNTFSVPSGYTLMTSDQILDDMQSTVRASDKERRQ